MRLEALDRLKLSCMYFILYVCRILLSVWEYYVLSSNCIGRKELSHVHINPHAMTRAMTLEGVTWKWGCILIKTRLYTDVNYVYVLIMQVYVMLFTALPAQARAYKNLLYVHWISTLDLHRYTWPGSTLIRIDDWPWQLNRHAISHDMACLHSWDKLQLMPQPSR